MWGRGVVVVVGVVSVRRHQRLAGPQGALQHRLCEALLGRGVQVLRRQAKAHPGPVATRALESQVSF